MHFVVQIKTPVCQFVLLLVAWQAHFITNMFINPTAEELEVFEPDFIVYNASKKAENYKELDSNSETVIMFNLQAVSRLY